MIRHFALALAASLLPALALAYEPHAPETWEREQAWRLSATPESQARASQLRQVARAGDSAATLNLLRTLDRDPALPAPARERLLLEFVEGLRQEPPRAVSTPVMQFLAGYPSTVLVTHEDHPRSLVPLFNIRSAAAGVNNSWTRQESAVHGARLLTADAARLVDAYAVTDAPAAQRGLLDALEAAAPEQRQAVAAVAMQRLEAQPGLTELAGAAAVLNEDSDLLGRLLRHARGAGVHRLLRQGAETFDTERNARLLGAALDSGSDETAALAIAQLAPALAVHAPSVDRLFLELGQAETGSAAALALAGNPDPGVLTRLEAIARDQVGTLAASRAQLALQLIEARLVRDVQ